MLLGYSSEGGSRLSGHGLPWGQRADSWVFLVAQEGARHVWVCVPKRETQKKKERKRSRERARPLLYICCSTVFLCYIYSFSFQGHFSFTVCGVNKELLPFVWEGFRWETEDITSMSIPSDSLHLLVYQSRVHQSLISSPTQNTARVIALSVENSACSNLACVHTRLLK